MQEIGALFVRILLIMEKLYTIHLMITRSLIATLSLQKIAFLKGMNLTQKKMNIDL